MRSRLRMGALSLIANLMLLAAAPARASGTEPEGRIPAPEHQAIDPEQPTPRTSPKTFSRAKMPPPPETDAAGPPRHSAVYWILGAGAPVGFEGIEGVHRFGPLLEVAAGFGIGFSATGSEKDPPLFHSTQWEVMPRLRLGGDRHALTLGAGLSGGNYGGFHLFGIGCPEDGSPCYYPTRYVFWGNVEVGTEHWWPHGFALRTFLGWARGCTIDSCSASNDQSFPYFGLGLGYAF
jgi:hypothetical protein